MVGRPVPACGEHRPALARAAHTDERAEPTHAVATTARQSPAREARAHARKEGARARARVEGRRASSARRDGEESRREISRARGAPTRDNSADRSVDRGEARDRRREETRDARRDDGQGKRHAEDGEGARVATAVEPSPASRSLARASRAHPRSFRPSRQRVSRASVRPLANE